MAGAINVGVGMTVTAAAAAGEASLLALPLEGEHALRR